MRSTRLTRPHRRIARDRNEPGIPTGPRRAMIALALHGKNSAACREDQPLLVGSLYPRKGFYLWSFPRLVPGREGRRARSGAGEPAPLSLHCARNGAMSPASRWKAGPLFRRGREAVSRRAHNPEIAGSIPAPATPFGSFQRASGQYYPALRGPAGPSAGVRAIASGEQQRVIMLFSSAPFRSLTRS